MQLQLYTKMGKLHCINATGLVAIAYADEKRLYAQLKEHDLGCIEAEAPCTICFIDDKGYDYTLYECTVKKKTICFEKGRRGNPQDGYIEI